LAFGDSPNEALVVPALTSMAKDFSEKLAVSERRACDVLEQCRATRRYNSNDNVEEARLVPEPRGFGNLVPEKQKEYQVHFTLDRVLVWKDRQGRTLLPASAVATKW